MTDADSLAEQRKQVARSVTHQAIVDATHRLLMTSHPATLSIPAVAEEAGVSVRTVYRYFPNKAALVDGVAFHYPRQAYGDHRVIREDLAATLDGLIELWTTLAENLEETRSHHQSPAGRELRSRRLAETRTQMLAFVEEKTDTPEQDRSALADILIAMTSSSMFLELTDRMGYAPEAAANLAFRSAFAVVDDFTRRDPQT